MPHERLIGYEERLWPLCPPQARGPVLRGRDDVLAIRAEGGGGDRALVPQELLLHGEGLRAIGLPDLRGPVPGGRDEALDSRVRAERGEVDALAGSIAQLLERLLGVIGSPHPRAAAPGHRDDVLPIRAEPGGADRTLVPEDADGAPSSALHTRAVPSCEAVTMNRPSRLNSAEVTGPSCPRSTWGSPLLSVCHTLAVPSSEAVTMCLPFGLKDAALKDSPLGPWSVTSREFESRASRASVSHGLTVSSSAFSGCLNSASSFAASAVCPRCISSRAPVIRDRLKALSSFARPQMNRTNNSRATAVAAAARRISLRRATLLLAPQGFLLALVGLRLFLQPLALSSITFFASQSCPSSK